MKPTLKTIQKKLTSLFSKYDNYTILSDWFELMALSIVNGLSPFETKLSLDREERFNYIQSKYTKNELKVFTECFALLTDELSNCQENGFDDWLGDLYMQSDTQSKQNSQIFTPYSLAVPMAEVTIQDLDVEQINKEDKIVKFNDPAVGGGCLPIAYCETLHKKGINYCKHAVIVCGDLDRRCIHMAYVQLSLIGVAARIENKNSITQELKEVWDTPQLVMHWMRFKNYVD